MVDGAARVVDVRVLVLVVGACDGDAVLLDAVLLLFSDLFVSSSTATTPPSTTTNATMAAMMIGTQLRFGGWPDGGGCHGGGPPGPIGPIGPGGPQPPGVVGGGGGGYVMPKEIT